MVILHSMVLILSIDIVPMTAISKTKACIFNVSKIRRAEARTAAYITVIALILVAFLIPLCFS